MNKQIPPHRVRLGILFAWMALLIVSGCGEDGSHANGDAPWHLESAPRARASIDLPDFPFWPNDALVVDLDRLTELATDYCAVESADPSAVGFFLDHLPMRAMDSQFCDTEPCEATQLLWADLYLSGYFGGAWLRELLGWDIRADSVESLRFVFDFMVGNGIQTLWSIEQDGDAEIIAAAKTRVLPLSVLYGYNLGFLQRILEAPPPGITPPLGLLDCRSDLLLDCNAPALDWGFLLRYEEAINRLRFPPDDRWRAMREDVDTAAGFVAVGDFVWSMINIDTLDEASYALLVDLSLNFLMAAKTVVLGHATSWAAQNAPEGRFAQKTDAGMIIWSGSYFMGLASPLEGFPILTCP